MNESCEAMNSHVLAQACQQNSAKKKNIGASGKTVTVAPKRTGLIIFEMRFI